LGLESIEDLGEDIRQATQQFLFGLIVLLGVRLVFARVLERLEIPADRRK
jgi:hypothetical protein